MLFSHVPPNIFMALNTVSDIVFGSSGFVRCVGCKDKCVTLLPPPDCEMKNALVSPRPLLFSQRCNQNV